MDNIFEKFSGSLKQTLMMSEKISIEQKSTIDTQHQLLALILQKGTLANDILAMFDVTVERAQLVAGLVGNQDKTVNGINQDSKEAIQLAVQFAMKYKHDLIDCEHLLMALISNKSFNSYNIIERMGVNPRDVLKQIESVFRETNSKEEGESFQIEEDFPAGEAMSEDEGISYGPFPGTPDAATKSKASKNSIKDYTIDVSGLAQKGKIDPVIGRDSEIERMIQILVRRKKNNPVLIGEPGVGKTAIVEGLALRIHEGKVPQVIADKKIYSLDLSSLLAGTMYRGQFETRIKKLLEDIEKNKNAILFIDELHTVIGAGSAEGSLDAANILKPKLARGEIRIIGATTFDEYKKHIERDSAFERRFQPVIINEPSINETVEILRGISKEYEAHHGVSYSDEALISASKLASRYIQDRFLPDKAIDLIDEAAAAYKMKRKASDKLTSLKKSLEDTIAKKDEAVNTEHYEKATFLRQKELSIQKQIEQLHKREHGGKIIQISSEDIAKVVSKWTGIPVNDLNVSDKKRYINLDNRLKKHIIGQNEAISSIASAIRRSRIGISNPNRPIGSFIFLGPTGVGKTELVKVLAREICGSEKSLIKIDMSEFMEKHNVSRLLGAPAGYVGYEEGGQLTEKVRRNPYSIILFDEIEKAHQEVFNVLLQILEDGEITDAKGRRVDFRNTIVIMTSNLGTNMLNHQAAIGFDDNPNSKEAIAYEKLVERVNEAVTKHFRPEFINRLDQIIVFKPLTIEDVTKIANLEINKLLARISEKDIAISVTPKAIKWLAEKGFKPEFGARGLRRAITDHVENPLSEHIISDEFKAGDEIKIDISKNRLTLTK